MNKNYLVKIRDFLKYGFTDEKNSLLGASKLDKYMGKNDGDYGVLTYNYSKSAYSDGELFLLGYDSPKLKKKDKKRKKD